MLIFETMESEVRSYSRAWPAVFATARGAHLHDENGRTWLDFFAGAGALNYGHNHPELKEALLDYLGRDGITHGLDMHTAAKGAFLERFRELVLLPRGLDYRVQFPGPSGTNAVEAALKLARKVTGRRTVAYFDRAFHGVTLGSLAITANPTKRAGAGVPLSHTAPLPYDDPRDDDASAVARLEQALDSQGESPAAVVVETVQGEGGVNVARPVWLRELARWTAQHDVLLVVDDVQMGCGRTGPFFSFEEAGIRPDVICLSKSISGYGLPMALTLMRPALDAWKPGEHNGTFRGYNPAFVTAARALELFWSDPSQASQTAQRAQWVGRSLRETARRHGLREPRGRGLVWALPFDEPAMARRVCATAYELGLLVETAGLHDEAVKLLPPLTIADDELARGLTILDEAVGATLERSGLAA